MDHIFFENWESIIRTTLLTILGYFAMIFLLRTSGKRTLSKMNAFDFVVTIALGSSLATLSLNKGVPLANGVLAFFLLIFLQYMLTWLSVRISKVKSLITSSPSLLFYQGNFLEQEMKKQRITEDEILKAGRQQGLSNLDEVAMIVLEPTGDLHIVEKHAQGTISTVGQIKV